MSNHMEKPVPGSTGGQGFLGKLIDHNETYGPLVMKKFFREARANRKIASIADLGAGDGRDLLIAKSILPQAKLIAVESHPTCVATLKKHQIDEIHSVNIERQCLPFAAESMDMIMANQVLEHTKEIFWITHEVTRSLKIGGYFIIGVPNVASFHNRLLLALGRHPTQHKLYSAHVRPFSKLDTVKFMQVCFPHGYELVSFAGSQFYPFPASVARFASKLCPNMAFSIFFMFKKLRAYTSEFIDHPVKAQLETPFYLGK